MLPTVTRLALGGLELKLAAGCALVLLALAERALALSYLLRWVRTGALSREEAYRRYGRGNRRSAAVFAAVIVIVAAFVFNPPFLGSMDDFLRQLGLQVCVYVFAYLVPSTLWLVLGEWLFYPTLRAELRPQAPAPRPHFAYAVKMFLLQQIPTALLLEATGALYVFALYDYRWVLPAGAAVLAAVRALASRPLYGWAKREVPLAQTPWADLGSRIQGWGALAEVRVADVRVEYLGESGLPTAATAGMWKPALYLGAELLANTDWRQRDAVIGHELGHISLGHIRTNALMSVLKAALVAGAFAYLDIEGIALALARLLRPELAPSLDARYGPVSLWPFLGVLLAVLWACVSALDRWRRHQNELACDRFSVGLVGDPLAKALVLLTIHKVAGLGLRTRSYTHPTTNERVRALLWMWRQPAPFAPWARWPVPAIISFADGGRPLTVPLATAPPIAPLPPAPWSRMPPQPPVPAPVSVPMVAPTTVPVAPSSAVPPINDVSGT